VAAAQNHDELRKRKGVGDRFPGACGLVEVTPGHETKKVQQTGGLASGQTCVKVDGSRIVVHNDVPLTGLLAVWPQASSCLA
jgi:hypothetical protein